MQSWSEGREFGAIPLLNPWRCELASLTWGGFDLLVSLFFLAFEWLNDLSTAVKWEKQK